uniref:Tudor domain-containing protein n=1 Tax=Rhabditophanes sp. KR3021 TaxID=114890 RepID=A0AC35U340_9BILA
MDNKALFEMEIHRKHGKKLIIQPHDASFHVVDKENDSISIERLNKEIGENEAIGSVFSIVWLLENTTRGTSNLTNPLLRYRLKFKYKVFEKDDVDGCLKEISFDRGYQLVSEFNFAIPTVEYEICAQLLSELPQTVVCRSLNNCEMVLSIRSIINKVETIIVGVDGDKSLWHIPTQLKQLTIKESGLGQITFTVVPQCVGFLPYPNITLYIFDKEHGNPEKIKEAIEPHSSVIGKQICIFSRTKGKQIHVLGQQISGANDNVSHNSSRHLKDENHSSSRSSLRDSAKQKLQKFFDK